MHCDCMYFLKMLQSYCTCDRQHCLETFVSSYSSSGLTTFDILMLVH